MEEIKEKLIVKRDAISKCLTEKEKNELFEAIRNGNNEKAKEIIETMKDIDEEIRYDILDYGGSALHLSCRCGKIELVKYLIELGADVNNIDKNKRSPLLKASINGNIEIVQLLLNAGANINYTDENENSALSFSLSHNRLDIFELLISYGIDANKCGGRALISASLFENIEIVERLIELGVNVNYADSQCRWSSLHYACFYNNIEFVKLLMEHGADESIQDNEGKTPIELTSNWDEEIKEFMTNYKPSKFVLKYTIFNLTTLFYNKSEINFSK